MYYEQSFLKMTKKYSFDVQMLNRKGKATDPKQPSPLKPPKRKCVYLTHFPKKIKALENIIMGLGGINNVHVNLNHCKENFRHTHIFVSNFEIMSAYERGNKV
jgi:hypothetical protein